MGRFYLFLISLLLVFSFLTPQALAVHKYHCGDQKPGSASILTSATPADKAVALTWIEAADPISHYVLAYGTSPTEILYGSPDIGGKGTTKYTVSQLTNGVKYYFWIRAVNGCKPGKLSNKLSATAGVKGNTSRAFNLSIYKGVSAVSTTAASQKKKDTAPLLVKSSTCSSCIGWQLLLAEASLLLVYFYFSARRSSLKQILSILIPIATYILFLKINGGCSKNVFFCKYFLQLDVIIFMLIAIAAKYHVPQKIVSFEHKIQTDKSI